MTGFNAGRNTTVGNANSFIGNRAGFNNNSGFDNTYVGYRAGFSNTAGSRNVAMGFDAAHLNQGSSNVILGDNAGFANVNGSNNVFLGSSAGYNETGSDKLYIDNSNTADPLVYGDFVSDQIGINTSDIPTGYALAVKGKIITEELKIRLYSTWPDYVFTKDYNLMPLHEVEQFIQKNGHLPNIPSADEVAQSGFETGAMNAKLLEKIEELTLHMIDLDKKVESPSTEMEAASDQTTAEMNAKLLQQMEALTQRMAELDKKVDALMQENAALKASK